MAMYACINDGDLTIRREVDGDKAFRAGTPPDLPRKAFSWVPIVIVNPSFDPPTQVRTGPVDVVTPTEVTRTWTVRNKTAQELEDEEDAQDEQWFRRIKPLLVALNNGQFVPGSQYTKAQLKTILRANR